MTVEDIKEYIQDSKVKIDSMIPPNAKKKADEVLQQGIQGITDLINVPALINLDFADVQTVMTNKGIAHIGIGMGKGEDKAEEAIKMAVESPLLETTIEGASDVIINVSGDISMFDADDAASYVQQITGEDVNIIFGAMYDDAQPDFCRVTVIATGLDTPQGSMPRDMFSRPNVAAIRSGLQSAAAKSTAFKVGTAIGLSAVAIARFAYSTRKYWSSIALYVMVSLLIPVFCIGYNPFSVLEARKVGHFDDYGFSRHGLMLVTGRDGDGIRDRYGLILPAEYYYIDLLIPSKPYCKVRKLDGWKIYDLEKKMLVSDEEFTDVIPYGEYSFLLKSEQGDRYLKIPHVYSRFSDRGDAVITDDAPEIDG